MSVKVLHLICPTGYYGAERWVNALVGANDDPNIEYHLAITDEPGASDEVLERTSLAARYHHRVPMGSKFDLRVIARLVTLLKEHRIDVLHSHGYKSDILGVAAARLAGVVSVCTPHGFENANDWRLKTYMWLGGKSFHWFDRVCPLSGDITRELIQRYQVDARRIRQIDNGVDLGEVERALVKPEPRRDSLFTIGYIGQLISRKNLTATLEAFAHFYGRHPRSRLVLIGDGEERSGLEHRSSELGISGAVEFLGFRDDRLGFLPTFDVFALTSSLEGIPRCLMEAMAADVCVTAFDIPGVDQLVDNGRTGVLVSNGDTLALSRAWSELAAAPAKRSELAGAGRNWVYQRFSASAMAASYASLYHDLMSRQVASHA